MPGDRPYRAASHDRHPLSRARGRWRGRRTGRHRDDYPVTGERGRGLGSEGTARSHRGAQGRAREVLRRSAQVPARRALERPRRRAHAGAEDPKRPVPLEVVGGAAARDARGRAGDREGGGASRSVLPQPRPAAGEDQRRRNALRRHPAHPSGRDRAHASPHARRDPLHHRGRARLHDCERRAHAHEEGGLRDHAQLDVARSRQRVRQADALARRARCPAGHRARRGLLRALRRANGERGAAGHEAHGGREPPLGKESPSDVPASCGQVLADPQLPLGRLSVGAAGSSR